MKEKLVYRIWDPVEEKFCSSGRGLYATNGRNIWGGLGGCKVALNNMPKDIRERLIIREYSLVETGREIFLISQEKK